MSDRKISISISGPAARPKPGDTRELEQAEIDRLKLAADVYDSYSNTFAMDGLSWRIGSKVCHSDGRTVFTLRAEDNS